MPLAPDPVPLIPGQALLLIFAKEPAPGQVKTRLTPPLSPAEAAELYHHFLKDVLVEMAGLAKFEVAVAFDPAVAMHFFKNLVPTGVRVVVQAEAQLGERLVQAFAWGFAQGYGAVLVRNSDSPDLPGAFVQEGREVLQMGQADVVLGPCPDGGYYLIGLRQPCPDLFRNMNWSTATVLNQTLAWAGQIGLQVHLLPPWPDIDDLNGLVHFLSKPLAPPDPGWRSQAWARKRLLPHLSQGSGTKS